MGNYAPLPVVVFFEGLDFFQSSSIPLSGQDLAAEGIVVVTVNYRLNVFGFFCLGSSDSRGNLGLLDQYFALLWIRENIKQFGGDPEKITLFGYLSGAVSVALHMVSPRTAGKRRDWELVLYFNRYDFRPISEGYYFFWKRCHSLANR